jgi:hypothetical protein
MMTIRLTFKPLLAALLGSDCAQVSRGYSGNLSQFGFHDPDGQRGYLIKFIRN